MEGGKEIGIYSCKRLPYVAGIRNGIQVDCRLVGWLALMHSAQETICRRLFSPIVASSPPQKKNVHFSLSLSLHFPTFLAHLLDGPGGVEGGGSDGLNGGGTEAASQIASAGERRNGMEKKRRRASSSSAVEEEPLSPSLCFCALRVSGGLPPCEDGVASRRASLSTPICSLLLRCEVEVRTARRRLQGSFFCLFRSWIEMGKKQQSSWKRNALSRKRMPRLNSNDCFDSIHPSLAFSIGVLENGVLCSISHIFFWTRQ